MLWRIAAVVALVLVLPCTAPAPERCVCRDGAKTGICAEWNSPMFGGRAAFFRRFRDFSCDADYRCDGICTFARPGVPLRLTVGERERVVDDSDARGDVIHYICKKGRRARCRKLAQQGPTTTVP